MAQTLTDPVDVAYDVLIRISTLDQTAPQATDELLDQWSEIIQDSGLKHRHLVEGVKRVYADGGEPPRNKLGAVLVQAKAARRDEGAGSVVAALAAPGHGEAHGIHAPAIPGAYAVNGAINIACPQCAAEGGDACFDEGGELCIPHLGRLHNAACISRGETPDWRPRRPPGRGEPSRAF